MSSLHSIVVGSNVTALGGAQLRYAERDAVALRDGITSQRLYDSVIQYTHIGRHAAQEVSVSVARATDSAGTEDAIMFFFAGHGLRELDDNDQQQLWLATGLRTNATTEGAAVLLADIFDTFCKSRAKSVTVILDCCFSGQQGGRSILGPRILSMLASGRPLLRVATPALSGEGRVVLSASRHDQTAHETSIHRHGMFSHALLMRLGQSQRADRVDIASVYVDVRRVVLRLTNGGQCPTLFGGDQGAELPTIRLRRTR
jgi:uncharacterized caspase-like protein